MGSLPTVPPADPSNVTILPDAAAVGARIKALVSASAREAVSARGRFALAIPGGSILDMLTGMDPADVASWAPHTTVVYVNHKCVDMDDGALSTHAKARHKFLNGAGGWDGVDVVVLDGSADGPAEAASYEEKLRGRDGGALPRDGGVPVFDLALIGVGDDGHVGSLYPDRDEVAVGGDGAPWVLPVGAKDPPSITLSLPVMRSAQKVVVAACGVSEKYPQGKSEGMRRAIAADGETIRSFPAVGLRGVATWVMDEAAGSALGDAYLK